MRKMLRRFARILSALLLFSPAGAVPAKDLQQPQDLYARSAVLMDGSSGRVLFGKNENEVLPMASTTKIMTCILALEQCGLKDVVSASEKAAAQPEVRLGVRAGETYYLEDVLYSLMLESYNDSAVMVAEHVAGSTEAFAAMMNEKAKQIGCSHTHFVTPNGLDAEDGGGAHATTAAELAKIMAYCVGASPAKETFLHITQARSHSFTDLGGTRSFSCQNHNAFLDMMEGAISGKTGFTSAAGYCYVGALESEGRLFIVALLACGWPYNRSYKWSDTRTLMQYGMEHYHNCRIEYTQRAAPIPVTGGADAKGNPWESVSVPVAPDFSQAKQGVYLLADTERIKSRIRIKKSLMAPVERGTVVGTLAYYLDETVLETYPIVALQNVEARCFTHWFRWVCGEFMM